MSAPARDAAPPMYFRWTDDEVMAPLNAVWLGRCQKRFAIGEVYKLEELSERSQISHAQQFAWLHDAWMNLPQHLADQFPSEDHLRKRALIDCGFYHETIIDVGTNAGALRVAAFARGEDQFASVVVRGPLVVVRKAKSQRMRGHERMDKAEFQASKTAIMDYIAALLGVTPQALLANAGQAA